MFRPGVTRTTIRDFSLSENNKNLNYSGQVDTGHMTTYKPRNFNVTHPRPSSLKSFSPPPLLVKLKPGLTFCRGGNMGVCVSVRMSWSVT